MLVANELQSQRLDILRCNVVRPFGLSGLKNLMHLPLQIMAAIIVLGHHNDLRADLGLTTLTSLPVASPGLSDLSKACASNQEDRAHASSGQVSPRIACCCRTLMDLRQSLAGGSCT